MKMYQQVGNRTLAQINHDNALQHDEGKTAPKKCEQCGKTFQAWPDEVYCSRACSKQAQKEGKPA